MFTLCFYVFASLHAVTPVEASCYKATDAIVQDAVAACERSNKDPLTVCEAQRMGALKWFIRTRKVGK